MLAVAALGAACGDNVRAPEDEPGSILVNAPTNPATSELGGEVEITVTLSVPPSSPLTMTVTTDTPAEGVASVERVEFEAGEAGPKRFMVRGVDDDTTDGEKAYQLVFGAPETADQRFVAARARSISLRNLDNDLPSGRLEVTRIFDGDGVVTSFPAGISCPPTCAANFPDGTTAMLSTVPAAGSARGGWIHSGTAVSFAEELPVDIEVGGVYAVSAGFVRDEVAWMTAIDGAGRERFDAVAAGGGKVVTGGHIENATTIGGQAIAHGGGTDPVIAAWSSADGAFRWLRAFGGSGDAHVASVAVLANGDVVAGGSFTGQLDLDGTVVTASGTDSFLVRLDGANGAVIWAQRLVGGPDAELAVVAEAPDGTLVACGTGAALVGWYDGAGGLLGSATPAGMSTCDAMDRRANGWYVGGWGSDASSVVYATAADDRTAGAATVLLANAASVRVDDVTTLADGGVVVAYTEGTVGNVYSATLVRRTSAGAAGGSKALGTTGAFLRSVTVVDDGNGKLLVGRRSGASVLVVERRDATTLDVGQTYKLETPFFNDFQLATEGARRLLVGSSTAARPFPGRPLTLLGGFGSFVAQLKL